MGADTVVGLPQKDGAASGGAVRPTVTGGQTGMSYAIGETQLTVAQLPSLAGVVHANMSYGTGGNDGMGHTSTAAVAGGSGAGTPNAVPFTSVGTNGAAHTHPVTGTLEHTHAIGGTPLPPWRAVYFIMYTG